MLDILEFEQNTKKYINNNCYIFCGHHEQLIKENIKKIIDININNDFKDLNYLQFDGSQLEEFDTVFNACETLPFMSEKKAVLIYRAGFLDDNKGDNKAKKLYKDIENYIKNIPSHCIFIMYYIMTNKRDKVSYKIKKLDKKACIITIDKIKGANLEKRVEKFFNDRGKKIAKIPLKAFIQTIENENLSYIENEVEKLCTYAMHEEIEKKHIKEMYESIKDEDIFDLINFISEKKPRKAIEILNELMYKGQKINHILVMIEKQFRNLYFVKIGMEQGKTKEDLAKELKIHPYGCSVLMSQSKKFTLKQIEKSIELVIETDKKIKTTSVNTQTEVELLIINSICA
ncbi:DNA polymerase III subunit delta [Clostridium botulinum]|uniref:DNA polymerase III subunit delta n=2 Tax=Clostridium TaxID=1485 RepID=A0A6B4K979_CLOBO|nr:MULTISPECIES: DNA polymerase III subunit delta [Clostridium]KOM97051.1 DNA polymerase III subunit delta [Clostridium botulinum]KOM99468.1 DNA polymerase III subunit delta [Clostridium botulinum]MBD5644474.1 DNA polymerase III subunit delta [Clostridium botulinum]MBY7004581.1 DNA polymerase III subunit delta [Clostridium botulinum]MCJ8172533.1 DNA polymerase III subunit delta [Clostridium botulinum]